MVISLWPRFLAHPVDAEPHSTGCCICAVTASPVYSLYADGRWPDEGRDERSGMKRLVVRQGGEHDMHAISSINRHVCCYPRESFREGLWNHRRTFVCLSVCLLTR